LAHVPRLALSLTDFRGPNSINSSSVICSPFAYLHVSSIPTSPKAVQLKQITQLTSFLVWQINIDLAIGNQDVTISIKSTN
jgi:hypothetical protein